VCVSVRGVCTCREWDVPTGKSGVLHRTVAHSAMGSASTYGRLPLHSFKSPPPDPVSTLARDETKSQRN